MNKRLGRNSKPGFTLVELLVVISIIGILASLILPGVMGARRAARRTQCLNNIKNVATAMTVFSASNRGQLPASGTWEGTVTAATGQVDYGGLGTWSTGMGNLPGIPGVTATASPGPKYSWVVDLLPFIDGQSVYDAWDFTANGRWGDFRAPAYTGTPNTVGNINVANTNLKVLNCPEDITTTPNKGNLSYVVNGGFSLHYLNSSQTSPNSFYSSGTGPAAGAPQRSVMNVSNMGIFFLTTLTSGVASRRGSLDRIIDGNSSTALISENINSGYSPTVTGIGSYSPNWASPHPCNTSFIVNGWGVGAIANSGSGFRYDVANIQTIASNVPKVGRSGAVGTGGGGINSDTTGIYDGNFPYPTSLHAGGVHVAMADGSALFINEKISGPVWASIVTPNGGNLVNPSNGNQQYVDQTGKNGFTQRPFSQDDIN